MKKKIKKLKAKIRKHERAIAEIAEALDVMIAWVETKELPVIYTGSFAN